ncbi:MAG: DUF6879 family protein [Solirubrobacteraceae bacterium]
MPLRLLQGLDMLRRRNDESCRRRGWAGADFWLFDDETVALMHRDEVGRFLGVAEAADIECYRAARQRAEALAVSLEDFIP